MSVFSLWKWELLSLVTSLLSFIAIVITLCVFQNRVLSNSSWKLPISINAIVAILSTLFKACLAMPVTEGTFSSFPVKVYSQCLLPSSRCPHSLQFHCSHHFLLGISQLKWIWFSRQPRSLEDLDLYDRASRGAWGAAAMVSKPFSRGPKPVLASFGALVALIVLATDPFSQASVSLKPCWIEADHQASIPRTNNYTSVAGRTGPSITDYILDAGMSLAAYMGVLNPPANSSVSVPVSCSTANCVFPSDQGATFTSLGMCTLTWDVSDQIDTLPTIPDNVGWNYTLPWGTHLTSGSMISSSSTIVPHTTFAVKGEGPWNQTSMLDVQLLGVRYKNSSCDTATCAWDINLLKPVAYLFSLIPCVQTYAANFTDGKYWEKVIDEQYLHWVVPKPVGFQLALNRTLHSGKWQDCVGTPTATGNNTVEVYPPPLVGSVPRSTWYPPECVYSMRYASAGALASFIGPGDQSVNGPGGFFSIHQGLTFMDDQGPPLGGFWMESLWKKGNMTLESVAQFAEHLGVSITSQLRKAAEGPDELRTQRGATLQRETCILVEWKFLSFLATILMLEVVFFISVIVVNYRSSWGADWKSSTLAVAFQNVGCATIGKEGKPSRELDKDLHEAARSVRVLFADVDGRWQLRKEPTF